jgi:hypothetical protein
MDWYYVQAGQRVGPVTIARFNELQTSGEINSATLVWNESMTDWQTLGSVRTPAKPPLMPAPSSLLQPPLRPVPSADARSVATK